eukprot:scaffold7717_cov296-Prasinococcus_capsulatus_cf.AAC.1
MGALRRIPGTDGYQIDIKALFVVREDLQQPDESFLSFALHVSHAADGVSGKSEEYSHCHRFFASTTATNGSLVGRQNLVTEYHSLPLPERLVPEGPMMVTVSMSASLSQAGGRGLFGEELGMFRIALREDLAAAKVDKRQEAQAEDVDDRPVVPSGVF